MGSYVTDIWEEVGLVPRRSNIANGYLEAAVPRRAPVSRRRTLTDAADLRISKGFRSEELSPTSLPARGAFAANGVLARTGNPAGAHPSAR